MLLFLFALFVIVFTIVQLYLCSCAVRFVTITNRSYLLFYLQLCSYMYVLCSILCCSYYLLYLLFYFQLCSRMYVLWSAIRYYYYYYNYYFSAICYIINSYHALCMFCAIRCFIIIIFFPFYIIFNYVALLCSFAVRCVIINICCYCYFI